MGSMKTLLLCTGVCVAQIACNWGTKPEPRVKVPRDYFERKLKCLELADKIEADRFKATPGSGFTQIQYSPLRNSCIASATIMGKKSLTFTIDDLLTDENIWLQSCRLNVDNCKDMGDKQEEVMRSLSGAPTE